MALIWTAVDRVTVDNSDLRGYIKEGSPTNSELDCIMGIEALTDDASGKFVVGKSEAILLAKGSLEFIEG